MLRRVWNQVARPLNRHRLRAFRPVLSGRLGRARGVAPVFVVAVSGTVGWLEPCLKLVPPARPLWVFDNGLTPGERKWVRSLKLPRAPRLVRLPVLPATLAPHGTVLDLLFASAAGDFVLLDHDCYVLEPALFEPPEWDEREMVAGIDRQGFVMINAAADLKYPRSHFLVVRGDAVRALMKSHAVGCEKATSTPAHLASLVGSIGIGDHNFPPPHLAFYDTLQLLWSVGFADGWSVRWRAADEGAISHVGGTTRMAREGMTGGAAEVRRAG